MEKAVEELEQLSRDPLAERLAQERKVALAFYRMDMQRRWEEGVEAGRKEGVEAGRKEGVEAGRKEGVEAGRKENQREMAQRLTARGMSLADVADALGVDVAIASALLR